MLTSLKLLHLYFDISNISFSSEWGVRGSWRWRGWGQEKEKKEEKEVWWCTRGQYLAWSMALLQWLWYLAKYTGWLPKMKPSDKIELVNMVSQLWYDWKVIKSGHRPCMRSMQIRSRSPVIYARHDAFINNLVLAFEILIYFISDSSRSQTNKWGQE